MSPVRAQEKEEGEEDPHLDEPYACLCYTLGFICEIHLGGESFHEERRVDMGNLEMQNPQQLHEDLANGSHMRPVQNVRRNRQKKGSAGSRHADTYTRART